MILVISILVVVFAFELGLSIINYRNRKAPIPANVSDVYDNDRYQKWLSYSMELFKEKTIQKCISFGAIVVLFISGFFVWAANWTDGLISNASFSLMLFIFMFYLLQFFIRIVFYIERNLSLIRNMS